MVAPLLPLAMMNMMPGMMPGMGLAMGGGAMAAGMSIFGKGSKSIGGPFEGGLFGGQKPKDIKFDKVTIKSLEIKDVSITNLSIGSTDKAEEGDFDKAKEDKGKIVDQTLTSDLEQEGTLTEKGFIGGMEDSLSSPIEGMSDSNAELNEVLTGKSSIGGGFPELINDTDDMTGSLDTIANNTKVLEDIFRWTDRDKEEGGSARSPFEQIVDAFAKWWEASWGVVTDIAKGAWHVISETAKGVWYAIERTAVGIWSVVKETAVGIWAGVKEAASGIWDEVTETGGEIWDEITESAGQVWDAVASGASATWEEIKEGAGNLWDGVKEGFDKAIETATNVWHELKNTGFAIWDRIGDTASSAWKTFTGGLADIASAIFGEEGETVILVPFAKDMMGTVDLIYDCMVDIKEILSSCCLKSSITEKLALESSDLTIISESDPNNELTEAMNENIAQEATSTDIDNKDKLGVSGVMSKNHPAQRPEDINLGQRADASRGMTPSHTKAPPKPRGHSARTINEMFSYNQYPNWRTRMG